MRLPACRVCNCHYTPKVEEVLEVGSYTNASCSRLGPYNNPSVTNLSPGELTLNLAFSREVRTLENSKTSVSRAVASVTDVYEDTVLRNKRDPQKQRPTQPESLLFSTTGKTNRLNNQSTPIITRPTKRKSPIYH